MVDDMEGWNNAQGTFAARAAARGDYSRIEARARAGMQLTPDEVAALDRRDRGVKLKRGQKDPQIDAETIAMCRWLHEVEGEALDAAYAFVGGMTGRTADAVKAAVRRAARSDGLGANIAEHAFNRHLQLGEVPPPLQARASDWKCEGCSRLRCHCDPAPRPLWQEGSGAMVVRWLIVFSRG